MVLDDAGSIVVTTFVELVGCGWLACCYSFVWDLLVWKARLLTIHCLALVGSEMVNCSHCILLHLLVWMAWFLALQSLVIIWYGWLDCCHYTSWNSLSLFVLIIVTTFSGICWSGWLNHGHFTIVSGISLRGSAAYDESIAVTGSRKIFLVWVACSLKLHSLCFVGWRDCCCYSDICCCRWPGVHDLRLVLRNLNLVETWLSSFHWNQCLSFF